jgi:hypothetical protein
MQLMNKNLCGILKGTKKPLTDPNKLMEWKRRDDKAKAILGLALLDFFLSGGINN